MTDPEARAESPVERVELTENRRRVLERLVHRHPAEAAETAMEISRALAPGYCRIRAEWAHPHLRWLRRHGLAEQLGSTFTGARTWTATDLGRAALAAERKGGEE
jgi:hypothetical protein